MLLLVGMGEIVIDCLGFFAMARAGFNFGLLELCFWCRVVEGGGNRSGRKFQ